MLGSACSTSKTISLRVIDSICTFRSDSLPQRPTGPESQRGSTTLRAQVVLELLRQSCAGRHQHRPRVPYSTIPTSLREYQRGSCSLSVEDEILGNDSRHLPTAVYNAHLVLPSPTPHSCLSFPPTASILDRAALLSWSFPHPSRLVSTFTSFAERFQHLYI